MLKTRVGRLAAIAAILALAACGGPSTGPAAGTASTPAVKVTPLIGDSPEGSATATVEMVEYASLACPHCRDFSRQVVPRIRREYVETGKVRYIYRDMSIHPDQFDVVLATIARCKGGATYPLLVDDFFGRFQDIMEAAQKGEAAAVLQPIAAARGLTWPEVQTCMDHTPELKAAIEKSGAEGEAKLKENKIDGRKTPSVFINGVYTPDISYEGVKAQIDKALAGTDKPASPAAAAPTPAAPAAPSN